eukprot:10099804-Alexandrium_andersonii.AAC.1
MLDGVRTAHAHSPASGHPGQEAPSEVRIDVCAESGPIVLPREVVDAPRAHDQVTDHPDKRRPVRG